MTRFVLDKNPEQDNSENLSDFINILESNTLNFITHSDPFLKINFFNKLIFAAKYPVIYLDFDLLFSGYIASKTITQATSMTLHQPNTNEFLDTFKTILLKISEKKYLVIIDSLNGLFNLHHNIKDAGRLVNCYIMLFCSIAKNSKSCILISGMTRRKKEEWVLSITGRRVLESKQMNTIRLERQNSSFLAKILDEKAFLKKLYKIPIQSELI